MSHARAVTLARGAQRGCSALRGCARPEADLFEGVGQGAVPDHGYKPIDFRGVEGARDLGPAAKARRLNDRCRDNNVVQHDGELLAEVRGGVLVEDSATFILEREVDGMLAGRGEAGHSAVDLVAGEDHWQVSWDGLVDDNIARARWRHPDEIEPAGRHDEVAHVLVIGDCRYLNHDAVGAFYLNVHLGQTVGMQAVLDDRADCGQPFAADRLLVQRQRPVLATQARDRAGASTWTGRRRA